MMRSRSFGFPRSGRLVSEAGDSYRRLCSPSRSGLRSRSSGGNNSLAQRPPRCFGLSFKERDPRSLADDAGVCYRLCLSSRIGHSETQPTRFLQFVKMPSMTV